MHILLQFCIYGLVIAGAVKVVPKIYKKICREELIEKVNEKVEDVGVQHTAASEVKTINEEEVKADKKELKKLKKL